jgi:hypothetical protein
MGVLGCSGDAVIVLVAGTVHQSDEQGAKQHGLTNRAVDRSKRRATSEPEPLKKAGQIVMVLHNGTGYLGCLSDEWK